MCVNRTLSGTDLDLSITFMATGTTDRAEGMGGLAKGLAVIEAMRDAQSITIAAAAKATGLTRATARRCLLTLAELGYVESVDGVFRPLPKLRALGSTARPPLVEIAQPVMDRLREAFNESISLAVMSQGHVVFAARSSADRIMSARIAVGDRVPLHCSAIGRVLLSTHDDEAVLALFAKHPPRAVTPRSLTRPQAILDSVRTARRQGYAIVDGELEIGLIAIAVPVVDKSGAALAALGITSSSARVDKATLESTMLPTLLESAKAIGDKAG